MYTLHEYLGEDITSDTTVVFKWFKNNISMHLLRHCNTFGEVTWLINIEPTKNSQMVAEQLKRNNIYNWLQEIYRLRHTEKNTTATFVLRHRFIIFATQNIQLCFTS
mmetsp:Transcript_20942/g.37430  ORF Transcript_20942/g.37430 Transcript_20942/m.37430 type:complete len:107 (+) Transcript_20942:1779-2099(+)